MRYPVGEYFEATAWFPQRLTVADEAAMFGRCCPAPSSRLKGLPDPMEIKGATVQSLSSALHRRVPEIRPLRYTPLTINRCRWSSRELARSPLGCRLFWGARLKSVESS